MGFLDLARLRGAGLSCVLAAVTATSACSSNVESTGSSAGGAASSGSSTPASISKDWGGASPPQAPRPARGATTGGFFSADKGEGRMAIPKVMGIET